MASDPVSAKESSTSGIELLRSVIEELAPIARLPTSSGERFAAHLICRRLEALGCRAVVEEVPAYGSYAWPIGLLNAGAVASGLVGGRGCPAVGAIGGGLAALGIADDITGRWLISRRLFMRRRVAYNVVADIGDPAASCVLCVLAHHDAAPSGWIFHPGIEEWLIEHHPDFVDRVTSNPPLWWLVISGPVLVSLGAAIRNRWLLGTGLTIASGSLAGMADIGHRPAVPGANDNLSGVAAMVALATALQAHPLFGLRVILVSAGAEEALQEGIRGFARRHFSELPKQSTYFVNLDTIGSGRLVLLEGEGPVRMHPYDARFKNLIAGCAAAAGIPLVRGLRSRYSTDGVVPRKHGYPTATLVSVDDHKRIPNYHRYTDVPDNVNYGSVLQAARLIEIVARTLARSPSAALAAF